MLSPNYLRLAATPLCKKGHPQLISEQRELPRGAVLEEVLRLVETQLQQKGLVANPDPDTFHPLWFLAETERNIFLWRQGLSLDQQSEFEFWVDLDALLQKRLIQLDRDEPDNPFLNPLLDSSAGDPALRRVEREYVSSFRDLLSEIAAHAHGLSLVASLLRAEVAGGRQKPLVVLPG